MLIYMLGMMIKDWENFYIVAGTAAATLVGLMFIAVTLGYRLITHETMKATQAFLLPINLHFAQAFFLSCVILIPGETMFYLGATSIILALMRLCFLPVTYRYLNDPDRGARGIETSDWILSLFLPLTIHFAFIVIGVALILKFSWALLGMGLNVLALLAIGIYYAWDMLIWMASEIKE